MGTTHAMPNKKDFENHKIIYYITRRGNLTKYLDIKQIHSAKSNLRLCAGVNPTLACWRFILVRNSENSLC